MSRMIEHALFRASQRQKIPVSTGRSAIRRRLIDAYPETRLDVFQTRIGWLGVAWTFSGIIALELPHRSRDDVLKGLRRRFTEGVVASAPPIVKRELLEYSQGRRRVFDLPLDWALIKPFQRLVLTTANRIPFGETRTYGWVAQEIGRPRAARAVGRALATNPIPLILPCHRVIGSSGSLVGYGGGLPLKRKLLAMETALHEA